MPLQGVDSPGRSRQARRDTAKSGKSMDGGAMGHKPAKAVALAVLVLLLAGCTDVANQVSNGMGDLLGPHSNHIIYSDTKGLVIEYFGDINATLPVAQRYCLQFEKVPLRTAYKEDKVSYACVAGSDAPPANHGALNSKLTLISDLLSM
jgi:hypothetical protein